MVLVMILDTRKNHLELLNFYSELERTLIVSRKEGGIHGGLYPIYLSLNRKSKS